MKLRHYDDIHDFYQQVEPFLLEREAEHNLPLGICTVLMQQPGYSLGTPFLASLESRGEIAAVALRTPPQRLVLSYGWGPESLALLADDVLRHIPDLPGVVGPELNGATFAGYWQTLTRRPFRLKTALRIYQLTAVRPVMGVSGDLRRGVEADRELLLRWVAEFMEEIEATQTTPERTVNQMLDSDVRGFVLWCDPEPVSMAGFTGPTPNGIRVGMVYTPPEHRRRGHASACVAALSQQLLDGGRKFCFLFTDLSNPTSNHIYQEIGYEPVSDVNEYDFVSG